MTNKEEPKVAFINTDLTQGTEEAHREHFHNCINEINRANLLEGITYEVAESMYCLFVSGPQEKLDDLDRFLREKNYGSVMNDEDIPLA